MSSSFSPGGVFQVMFRHKWKMAAFFAATLLAGWAAMVVWPRTYESEVKLIVRVGRESVSLDPTATTSQTLMLQKSQEDEINSALDVLSSRHLAELVVDRLGPAYVLTGGGDAVPGARSGGGGAVREAKERLARAVDWCITATHVRDAVSDRERAVRNLRKNLAIYAPKASTVITINYHAKSPVAAQRIAAEITDVYLSEHVRVSRTQGSREFFDEQTTLLADRLQHKIQETSEFRRSHAIVSIAANQELVKEQLSGVEGELRVATVTHAKADAEVAFLKAQLARIEPELVSAKIGSADLTWSGMRQLIFQLEIQEKELASKYTAEHPLLAAVRNQLQSVREQFDEKKADRSDATVTPNPIAQELTQQLLTAEAQSQGVQQSIATLQEQRREVLARLDGLIEQEAELTRLEREAAVLDANYRNHQEKLEEARIIDALQTERISNVNVVQPAPLVERPTSPNKRAIAALALFLGLAGALGVAFLAEALDPTLRTREQAESQLGMPVLSTIPAGLRRRDLLKSLTKAPKGDILDLHCKSLLQQVLYSQPQSDNGSTTLGVLSVSPGNGGSTLAAQLAIVASRDLGLSTLLIDTDNEQKFVSRSFRLNGAPGLRELLANEAAEADCIQQIGKRNLAVISSASQDKLGALKLDPRHVGTRLESLRRRYDLVIVDLPPAASSSDGVSLSGLLDHVLLVVESERTIGASAKRVRAQLLRSNAKLSGTVLTKTRDYLPRWLHASV
ncbi:MAG: GumC family protein [Planctomycetaceae bacterium]